MTTMIQTSKDILFLILGVSVLVVSFFFCFLFFYLIKVVKEFYKATKSVRKVTQRADEISKTVKEKVREFTLLPLLSEAIRTVIEFLKEKKKKKEEEKEKEN